jgi:hemerythrin-like metal-binding protein
MSEIVIDEKYTSPSEPSLHWADHLAVDMASMDETHVEFVALLGQAQMATDAELMDRYEAVLEHTQDHFEREDRWMTQTQFGPMGCHAQQHDTILQVMREGLRRGRDLQQLPLVRQLLHEVGMWFEQHAQTMDAGLAMYLKAAEFDPETGIMAKPEAVASAPQC